MNTGKSFDIRDFRTNRVTDYKFFATKKHSKNVGPDHIIKVLKCVTSVLKIPLLQICVIFDPFSNTHKRVERKISIIASTK